MTVHKNDKAIKIIRLYDNISIGLQLTQGKKSLVSVV